MIAKLRKMNSISLGKFSCTGEKDVIATRSDLSTKAISSDDG